MQCDYARDPLFTRRKVLQVMVLLESRGWLRSAVTVTHPGGRECGGMGRDKGDTIYVNIWSDVVWGGVFLILNNCIFIAIIKYKVITVWTLSKH